MEQGQIPPQQQPPPPAQPVAPPPPQHGQWPAWQQHPSQPGWEQTPYGYAPVPYGYAPPPQMPVPAPGQWAQPPAYPAQLKAPPDEHPAELPWQLSGWWSRVGAQLLDVLVVWVPAAIVLTVLAVLADAADNGSGTETTLLVAVIVATFLAFAAHFFYAPLLMKRRGKRNGQTWGKQACGIRVIRADGKPMRFSDAALRQIIYKSFGGIVASTFVPLFPWILNYLWPTWDEQHRALHDLAADTRVVAA
jgi:uncharacterized RDD family membrane protein YckC